MLTIALDAMGGDRAPGEIVRGALDTVGELDDVSIVLVGDEARVAPLLEGANAAALDRIDTFHCTESVAMDEKPAQSMRSKPDSSLKRSAELVAEGRAQAMISAGNTGAQVAISAFVMGLLPEVSRPGIAVNFPGVAGPITTIDVGANVFCRPRHLFEYGVMGSVYQRHVMGADNPRVGLLSIGAERTKGNSLTRETIQLFEASDLNFVGNVEGNAILTGSCDVLVCDGFAGNIMLKTSEGVTELLLSKTVEAVSQIEIDGIDTVVDAVREVMASYDYSAYGGAPLFGCRGASVICHGRSNARAIGNAVRAARAFSHGLVNEHIVEELEKNKALFEPAT